VHAGSGSQAAGTIQPDKNAVQTNIVDNDDTGGSPVWALGGDAFTVIGVMPAGFENVAAGSARIWGPLQYDATAASFQGREWGHHLRVVGRLRRDVAMDEARRDLVRIAGDPVAEFPRPPWASLALGLRVASLREGVTRAARSLSLAVLGAVALLLFIACVNVTNLLLARGVRRRDEFAMRMALGAGRGRMSRQLVTESLLLAGLAGILGLVLAAAGLRTLLMLSPPGLPRLGAVHLDGTAFAVAVGISTLAGVVVGMVPAMRASHRQPREAFQRRSSRSTGTNRLARGALVTAQVAISLVLLVGAGLLLRSLDRLLSVDPGFDASGVLALQVQVSGDRFAGEDAARRYFSRVVEEVRGVPGVARAALTSQLPLGGQADLYGVQAVSAPDGRGADSRPEGALPGEDHDGFGGAFRYTVSPGYFRALGIPLLRGRVFDERDAAGATPTVIVSESLARRRFPDQDALGRRIHVGRTDLPPYTVVGVVGDVSQVSLAAGRADGVYVPLPHWYFADAVMWLVAQAEPGTSAGGAPARESARRAGELAAAVKAAIWSADDDQPIVRVATMQDLLETSAAERRFALRLFQAFALVALVLAAFGIHGVLAGTVGDRRPVGPRRVAPRHRVGGRLPRDDVDGPRDRRRTGRSRGREPGARRPALRGLPARPDHLCRCRRSSRGGGGDGVRRTRVAGRPGRSVPGAESRRVASAGLLIPARGRRAIGSFRRPRSRAVRSLIASSLRSGSSNGSPASRWSAGRRPEDGLARRRPLQRAVTTR